MAKERFVEVTYTVKALFIVGENNALWWANHDCQQVLMDLHDRATVDIDEANIKDWGEEFIPYGANKNARPLKSHRICTDYTPVDGESRNVA